MLTTMLTAREVQVVVGLAQGLTNEQIGECLGIATLTVKSHMARIGDAVGSRSRAGIVGLAFRQGLLTWKGDELVTHRATEPGAARPGRSRAPRRV